MNGAQDMIVDHDVIVPQAFRRLGKSYLSFDDQLEVGLASIDDMPTGQASLLELEVAAEEVAQAEQEIAAEAPEVSETSTAAAFTASASTSQPVSQESGSTKTTARQDDNAPLCYNCGNQTQRAGTCYVCTACGSTTGCS